MDSGYSWVIFLVSSFGYTIMGGYYFGSGFFVQAMMKDYGWDITSTTLIGSVFIAVSCLLGPLTGWMVSRSSHRVVIIIGGLFMIIGNISCFFAPTVHIMTITFTLIGIGLGFVFTPSVSIPSYHFKRYLNTVSGISSSGAGIGTLVFPYIFQYCYEKFALKGTFFILAGISSHVCLFGALCRPNQIEMEAHKKYRSNKNKICDFEILKNIPFLLFCLSVFFWNLALPTILIFLPLYCDYHGSTAEETALVYVLMGLANISSRILTGIATNADNINDLTLYIGSFGLAGILTILLPFYGQNLIGQMLFGIFLNLYINGVYSIFNSVNIKLVGIERVSMATGVEMFFIGVGILVGPTIGAAIGTYFHSLDLIFIFSGVMFLGTPACALLMSFFPVPQIVEEGVTKHSLLPETHEMVAILDEGAFPPWNDTDQNIDPGGGRGANNLTP